MHAQRWMPCTDFGSWGPFGRRVLRAPKFRAWCANGGGSWPPEELLGPENCARWTARSESFVVPAKMLSLAMGTPWTCTSTGCRGWSSSGRTAGTWLPWRATGCVRGIRSGSAGESHIGSALVRRRPWTGTRTTRGPPAPWRLRRATSFVASRLPTRPSLNGPGRTWGPQGTGRQVGGHHHAGGPPPPGPWPRPPRPRPPRPPRPGGALLFKAAISAPVFCTWFGRFCCRGAGIALLASAIRSWGEPRPQKLEPWQGVWLGARGDGQRARRADRAALPPRQMRLRLDRGGEEVLEWGTTRRGRGADQLCLGCAADSGGMSRARFFVAARQQCYRGASARHAGKQDNAGHANPSPDHNSTTSFSASTSASTYCCRSSFCRRARSCQRLFRHSLPRLFLCFAALPPSPPPLARFPPDLQSPPEGCLDCSIIVTFSTIPRRIRCRTYLCPIPPKNGIPEEEARERLSWATPSSPRHSGQARCGVSRRRRKASLHGHTGDGGMGGWSPWRRRATRQSA